MNIIQSIQGHTSGMAVPHFVIDAPDGGGKIPLLPDGYLVQIDNQKATLKNYEDKIFSYPQPQDNAVAGRQQNNHGVNGHAVATPLVEDVIIDQEPAMAHPSKEQTNGYRPVSSRT